MILIMIIKNINHIKSFKTLPLCRRSINQDLQPNLHQFYNRSTGTWFLLGHHYEYDLLHQQHSSIGTRTWDSSLRGHVVPWLSHHIMQACQKCLGQPPSRRLSILIVFGPRWAGFGVYTSPYFQVCKTHKRYRTEQDKRYYLRPGSQGSLSPTLAQCM